MKEIIKAYFEEQIKTDEALKAVYDESKLDDCVKYITDQARKYLKGVNGAIEDTVVYKWARDFMYGDIEKPAAKEEPKTEKTEASAEEIPETLSEEQIEPEEKPAVTEPSKLVIESVQQNEKPVENFKHSVTKSKKPVDEYDGPSLFDFDNLY